MEKCPNMLIFHTFWLVICKLVRIRIQFIILMRIRILPFIVMRIHEDPDLHHMQEVKAFQGKCHQKSTVPVLVWNQQRILTPSSQEVLNLFRFFSPKVQIRIDYSGSGKRLPNRPNLDPGPQHSLEVLIGFQYVICPWASCSGKIKTLLWSLFSRISTGTRYYG